MIESTLVTGTKGLMIVQDNTDGTDKTVDLYVQCTTTHPIPNFPWTYSIDGVMQPWKSFNFTDSVLRQHLALVYVGFAEEFTLHVGTTSTSQMGGPTDLAVDLNQHGVRTVSILVDGSWKSAVPYVRDAGVWKPASAFVMKDSTWVEAT
jgi:hypothetical protein